MKTHIVLDLQYNPEISQKCFDGTLLECENWVLSQNEKSRYTIVPMSDEERWAHPDNAFEIKQAELCRQAYLNLIKNKVN